MPNITPTFPKVIDASIRSAFVACPRQGFYQHILNLRREEPSIHLHFGKCVAAGLETGRKAFWRDGRSATEAVSDAFMRVVTEWGDFDPPESVRNSSAGRTKTLDAALDAVGSYFERYPLASDVIRPFMINGEPAVEMSFALPFGPLHPETHEPLLYAGRFDMIGRYNNAIVIIDEKTTTRLGEYWKSSWPLRGQLTGYVWGCRSFGVNASGCIVRGIGILRGDITFEEAITARPDWHVEAWLRQLRRDVSMWLAMWHDMKAQYRDAPHLGWDQAFDQACSAYGGCGYVELCDTPDPRRYYDDYVVSAWNPLERSTS